MHLTQHSRGIAESHILLACHHFHKLHNLGEQKHNRMCDIIMPQFYIRGLNGEEADKRLPLLT